MTTVQEHCCGANSFFDDKVAGKQYKQYLKKGPSRVTKGLIAQLSQEPVKDKTLIDVGGGIGAIQWWFLENGGRSTSSVDSSESYLNRAREHAASKSWLDKSAFVFGDFVDLQNELDQADYVTLDKVICCYPEYRSIISAGCRTAKYTVSVSYPMSGLIAKIISMVSDLIMKIRSKDFRPYIHPANDIRLQFEAEGFALKSHKLVFPWHIETYRRIELNT